MDQFTDEIILFEQFEKFLKELEKQDEAFMEGEVLDLLETLEGDKGIKKSA